MDSEAKSGNRNIKKPDFLTPNAKKAFNHLCQAFIKASILQYFNPKYHIQIEIDASSYAISGLLSQLTLDSLGH